MNPFKKSSAKKRDRKKSQTFILEPILTPSGLVDGADETLDAVAIDLPFDLDTIEMPEIEDLDVEIADVEVETVETEELFDSNPIDTEVEDFNLAEIANGIVKDFNIEGIADTDLEEIPFITSLDNAVNSEVETETLDLGGMEGEISDLQIGEALEVNDDGVEVQALTAENDSTLLVEVDNPDSLVVAEENSTFESGTFTVGETGEVSVDFLFDGGAYEGEVAIFSLEGMDEFEPGSREFVREAARRALSDSEWGHVVIKDRFEGAAFTEDLEEGNFNDGEYLGPKTYEMRSRDEFGFMLVPKGRVEDVFNNPDIGGAKRPLFSLVTANPDDGFQVGQIADVTGDGSTFAFEDLRIDGRSDRDYNDIVFQVRGARGSAVSFDEVIDPAKDWRETEIGQDILDYAQSWLSEIPDAGTIEVANPLSDLSLNTVQPTATIDLSQVFADSEGRTLQFEVVEGDGELVAVEIDGDRLYLAAGGQTGIVTVAIRAFNEAGQSVTQSFEVTTNALAPAIVEGANAALSELQQVIAQFDGDLFAGFESEEAQDAIASLETLLEENPNLLSFFDRPESLADLGINTDNLESLQQILNSSEVAADLGLPATLGEILSQPDRSDFDLFLTNANDAIALLPETASQPPVGFIDFSQGQHIDRVTAAFASLNPIADYQELTISGGNWAEKLVQFVDSLKNSGAVRGILNLSLDLSQLDDLGVTTRYELTPAEQYAIQYARENNVLLVVASGNTGGRMSALGEASQTYDNIITVGAINHFEAKTDYSAYGNGLTLVAPGSEWQDDPKAFVGTSKATAYVTAAASLVWATNPDLNFQQVKELLIDTAADINLPGWDAETGAGLLDVQEAVSRALLITPLPLEKIDWKESTEFSGEGRSRVLARPTSEEIEDAIAFLEDRQNTLLDQWQVLADLGNPALSFDELDTEVKQKILEVFATYQQVNSQAEITSAIAQQWQEALALATQYYQIEKERLQNLLTRQQELEEYLAKLGEQKVAVETETQKLIEELTQDIARAEADLEKAKAKLLNPFANADDNLQINPTSWQQAAEREAQNSTKFQETANILAEEAARYQNLANSVDTTPLWRVTGTERGTSGRSKPIWGSVPNTQAIKQQQQYQWQAQIAAQNPPLLKQFEQQAEVQKALLKRYAEFIEEHKNDLNIGQAEIEDAAKILEFLQQQAAEQQKIADNYAQLTAIAAGRQQQNQNLADYHNSQSNRWEVIGTKRTGRSGQKVENVYSWVRYPEHIAPRDRAQQLANQAAQEKQAYQQLALQAQQQADAFQEQARKLEERLRDWLVLKQGIEYEIQASELHLQASQDLLAMHDPVQEQKLETLQLQIEQTAAELERLNAEKLPEQQQLTDATEERLQETQSQWQESERLREEARDRLQNTLEVTGFLLPYRERLTAIQTQIKFLENEQIEAQFKIQSLIQQIIKTPSNLLSEQLQQWQNYLEKLQQELDWARLQQEQLALALADSPERLAIAALIRDLETASPALNATPKIANLKLIEGSGSNFLSGFDNLTERLNRFKTEAENTQQDLQLFQEEYVDLGLEKAYLDDRQIPEKQEQIAAKEREITEMEDAIAKLEVALQDSEETLERLQGERGDKVAKIEEQERAIASIQTQLAEVRAQIVAKDTEIKQQQSILQDSQNQIARANATVNSFEQQRQQHQNAANYWNSQIKRSGNFFQRIHNMQAIRNRDAAQAAANQATQQRDTARIEAQQLTASLQLQITATQQSITELQAQKELLILEQQQLQARLAPKQTQLQQLQAELQAIDLQIAVQQNNLSQQQQQIERFEDRLQAQQQQRDSFLNELANLEDEKANLERQLIEKYREIELTEKYESQIEQEVDRLQSRQEILNRSGILEQQYRENWDEWQQAVQTQTEATNALLQLRETGEPDRALLATLQTQLAAANSTFEQAKTIQQSLLDTQQILELSKLQLGNQQLLLTSLSDRDATLALQEARYLNQADAHSRKIWYWNGNSYAYNAAEAAAYRANLEQASFVVDTRNKLWQQRQQAIARISDLDRTIAQQNSEILDLQSQLNALEALLQLEAQATALNTEIQTVSQRLQALQIQEQQQTQRFQEAAEKAQNLTTELIHTAELQADSLRQLIGLGMLASESDVDFFATQIEPKIKDYLAKLQERLPDLNQEIATAQTQSEALEERLATTTDEASKQALTELLAKQALLVENLERFKAQAQTSVDELKQLLQQANDALLPLRQKQELEIRQTLENNQIKLERLESQNQSEQAAEAAIRDNSVLAYVQLKAQVHQDLIDGVPNWTQNLLDGHQDTKELGTQNLLDGHQDTKELGTQHLLDGHQDTKELGTQHQNLSRSTDELIAEIAQNFADPHADYHQTAADLRDALMTWGVVANKEDQLDLTVASTADAIARIKLRLEQDAKLWEEIAPIAIRYGLESAEFKNYQAQRQAITDAKELKIAQEIQPLRDRAALLEQQAIEAYNRSQKRGATWTESIWTPVRGFWFQPGVHWDPARGWGYWQTVQRTDNNFIQFQNLSREAATLRQQADTQQQQIEIEAKNALKALPTTLLENHPSNGSAIAQLQQVTLNGTALDALIADFLNATEPDRLLNADAIDGRNPLQALYDKAKAAQADREARGYAALAQADWYEQQAAYHWARSRKNGPTWTERRKVKGRSGKSHWETIVHTDHDWIIWDNYSKIFPQLRQQGTALLAEADKWRKLKERLEPLAQQWTAANDAANLAQPVIEEARNFFAELEAARESIPADTAQLASLEELLPLIEQHLQEAQREADAQNAKVRAEWEEYDTNSEEYRQAVAEILQRRGELNREAIALQQAIADSEKAVERQSVALADELTGTKTLIATLQQQRQLLENQLASAIGPEKTELETKLIQLNDTLPLLTNKATLLTAQQTALTEKRTLLTAQNEVILAEQRLLDAYLQDPTADTSALEQQLLAARAALAEAQRLAEQAESLSKALSAPLQDLKIELLVQNDEHLKAARESQQLRKQLVEATQVNANYALQAAQKQQEVNTLEFQILQRLQEAAAAGYQEAKHLLDVAKHNNIATAAEIYYRDYADLASDRGGCAGGAGRANDRVLADRYYAEMLAQRELQRRAQAQADAFKQARQTAERQMGALQAQQETAARILNDLNEKLATTQEERERLEQELAIARTRLDGITCIREQTEQTFNQLIALEQLNLQQAQLEQAIAEARNADIDAAIRERMERDRLELERDRLETQARIEQLQQLQVEDELRQSLNGIRSQLGLATLDPAEDPIQIQTQLAGLLASLKDLQNQDPELPGNLKALLTEVQGDINLALQGKEAATIQENLLGVMDGLIGQVQQYKTEINRIDLEEQWDNQLLQTAQNDLQTASQDLLKELERIKILGDERSVIDPLYLEVLNKVAYADQAVDISEELAKQSKEFLDQIIKQRIEQRKLRKKMFWLKVLGIIRNIIGILGFILKFTPLAPLGIALNLASAGIGMIQTAITGDWSGGIFQGVIAGINFLTSVLPIPASVGVAIQSLTGLAQGAFNGIRSMMSGEGILGFLQILSGVASAITTGLSSFIDQCSDALKQVVLQVFNSLKTVPLQIYSAIEGIKNGDWFAGIGSILNAVGTLGSNFAGIFNDTAAKVFNFLNDAGNSVGVIGNAIKEGGIAGWLSGINGMLGIWGDDLLNLIDRLKGEPINPVSGGDGDRNGVGCTTQGQSKAT